MQKTSLSRNKLYYYRFIKLKGDDLYLYKFIFSTSNHTKLFIRMGKSQVIHSTCVGINLEREEIIG